MPDDPGILSRAIGALRDGFDIVVIAMDREDAERLAEEILVTAKVSRIPAAESIGDRYELCSEIPLVYVRAYDQECQTWERRTGTYRPLMAVRHPSVMSLERFQCLPPRIRSVFA